MGFVAKMKVSDLYPRIYGNFIEAIYSVRQFYTYMSVTGKL